jgi:hypothetical protein
MKLSASPVAAAPNREPMRQCWSRAPSWRKPGWFESTAVAGGPWAPPCSSLAFAAGTFLKKGIKKIICNTLMYAYKILIQFYEEDYGI